MHTHTCIYEITVWHMVSRDVPGRPAGIPQCFLQVTASCSPGGFVSRESKYHFPFSLAACCWWARASMKAFLSLGLSGMWGTTVLEKTAESSSLVASTKERNGCHGNKLVILWSPSLPCSRRKKNHSVYRCMITYCFLLPGKVAVKASPGDEEQQTREKRWL